MSRFKPGDRVRVVQVTTHEHREPITNPNHPDAIDWTGTPLIGAVGVVTDVFPDRQARNNIRLNHLAEAVAFPDADLERVES
ncbi:hypothetical protein [Mycobacterium kiyosense]|uniref:Uncharacterized protein n=1 Tax=Mycobacterium kiyosense TaxID=2871094 RepID=A0A9P3V235_9MYCO|nr:hypothetical protein [Mycobacterium kiyosense]GLB83497.1 hypothetical protein SRL2020028_27530 [Mycobacterium kiyosense]GLB99064.1 hypothetical protein SRL2020226_58400 [Mycobacterium kiyosense]GLD33647.1 hypothetical protein Mkiyose1413_55300 [Mycobacterium kiyosense]GLD37222.1 hypothetical protein Mkiyose1595_34420 [Mycobacterium kiyosense]